MSRDSTGEGYSLSHMVLERARVIACIPAKLIGVGGIKILNRKARNARPEVRFHKP